MGSAEGGMYHRRAEWWKFSVVSQWEQGLVRARQLQGTSMCWLVEWGSMGQAAARLAVQLPTLVPSHTQQRP